MIFAAYFILRGRGSELIFCGYCLWHDLLSDTRAFSLTSFEK